RLIIVSTSAFPSVDRSHHDAAPSANAEVKPMLGAIYARIYEMIGLAAWATLCVRGNDESQAARPLADDGQATNFP
ncbi:MAG: hypothetical protein L0H70_09200, partial [Xanthomonadales bacterium]|nr:hypothetical protein [Xanthomonadales bacterium]